MTQLKITYTKSSIGCPESQRKVIQALGLRRLHQSVLHGDSPTMRGMVHKVRHLVLVEQVEGSAQRTS
jgi:large subunit ribosomal protein L30